MIHQGQRLPLHFEAGDDARRIHPHADDLERDAAAHGLQLLGLIDNPMTALPEALYQPIASDPRSQAFREIPIGRLHGSLIRHGHRFRIHHEKFLRLIAQGNQFLKPRPQSGVPTAGLIQEILALLRILKTGESFEEDFFDLCESVCHAFSSLQHSW